jgi:hypothetical protein
LLTVGGKKSWYSQIGPRTGWMRVDRGNYCNVRWRKKTHELAKKTTVRREM